MGRQIEEALVAANQSLITPSRRDGMLEWPRRTTPTVRLTGG